MAWQIKATYEGLSPSRWLNKDHRGFYTTSQGKAKFFDSKDVANSIRDDVAAMHPGVRFEVVEIPG